INIKQFVELNPDANIHDIAFTLQTGREAMEERLAVIVSEKKELVTQLTNYIEERPGSFYTGNIRKGKSELLPNDKTNEINQLTKDNAGSIAGSWVEGFPVDWTLLYSAQRPNKISLPTYPFASERYWYKKQEQTKQPTIKHTEMHFGNSVSSIWESDAMKEAEKHAVGSEIQVQLLEGGIALVKMESRSSRNMISYQLVMSLKKTFLDLRKNKELKVVVLTGYENVFCMGGTEDVLSDLASMKGRFTEEPFLYRGLLEFDVPVITAMQGHAFGAGLVFGLYGDIVLMSAQATYTANFMKYGFTPGIGGTYILGEKLGRPLAAEMMYTAKLFSGEEIKSRGALVIISNAVLNEALQIAKELITKPRIALQALKQKMSRHILADLPIHIEEEADMHELTFHTEEVKSLIADHFGKASLKKAAPDETIQKTHTTITLDPTDTVTKETFFETDRAAQPIKLEQLSEEQPVSARFETVQTKAPAVIEKIKKIFSTVLQLPVTSLGDDETFIDFGLDSISSIDVVRLINEAFDINLEAVILYDYHTFTKLAALIAEKTGTSSANVDLAQPIQLSPAVETKIILQETQVKEVAAGALNEINESNISEVIRQLKEIFQTVLHIPATSLDESTTFTDFGLDSISGIEIIRLINKNFNTTLEAIYLYDYHTLHQLATLITAIPNFQLNKVPSRAEEKPALNAIKNNSDQAMASAEVLNEIFLPDLKVELKQETEKRMMADKPVSDIAIIGISGKFPEAENVNQFWDNLKEGKNSIKEVPERKWPVSQFYSEDKEATGRIYSKWMGYLDNEDKFDALFFNISPKEAEKMDPQQRLFLEECYKVIEDAGYSIRSLSGSKCGVFAGVGYGDYTNRFGNEELDDHILVGASISILASRISYYLNLQGPAISIDTACSSSLVAIHQACQSIRTGECETAIAGGVYVMTSEQMHLMTSKAGMLSEDGHCYTFDNRANGFVPSEAVAVLFLKSLEQAEKDGDPIYGVIKGSGINQDGKTNGITAPSFESQTRLEKEVYEVSKINPVTITYIETHGTGTKLGDPIEIKALKQSFGAYTNDVNYCGIGSVKTNIGHTLYAAGVSSVIKVLLSIK
ncbi:MAG: beta-ketoacyl synthase N-terminal-like domain-containing protein, partial [Chitinophagaceae bacterium]